MEGKENRGESYQGDQPRREKGAWAQYSTETLQSGKSADEGSSSQTFCTLLDGVNHALILLLTIFLLYHSLGPFTPINLHVALCTLGYVLLMAEGILILAGENLLTNSLSRRAKSHIHWILQVLGMGCTLAGVIILYLVRSHHFKSTHSILGISSVAIMLFLVVFGYPVLAAVKLRKLMRPVLVKCFHSFLGIICFAIGIAAQCYGYKKKWLVNVTNDLPGVQVACIVLTVLITIFSLRSALVQLWRHLGILFK